MATYLQVIAPSTAKPSSLGRGDPAARRSPSFNRCLLSVSFIEAWRLFHQVISLDIGSCQVTVKRQYLYLTKI